MNEEASMYTGRRSCQQGIVIKEHLEINVGSGSSTPLFVVGSPHGVDHHTSSEDIRTPLLFRSEVEQLIDYDLIKALSNFKQSLVAPSSPSTQQSTSLEKKAVAVQREGNQSCSRQQRIKSKF
jgi:hypothetical protein